jgi:hypothetical protein
LAHAGELSQVPFELHIQTFLANRLTNSHGTDRQAASLAKNNVSEIRTDFGVNAALYFVHLL